MTRSPIAILSTAIVVAPIAVFAFGPARAYARVDAPSSSGFLAGAFLGDEATTPERVSAAIDAFGAATGQPPSLVKSFHDLAADFTPVGWAGRLIRVIHERGAANLIALDLQWPNAPRRGLISAVANGEADQYLAALARELGTIEGVVLLEPAWEMNGNWNYPWQGVANGGTTAATLEFQRAWRHLRHVFDQEGAANVRFVFAFNTGNALTGRATGPAHWNWFGHYYPGDEYVDYIGVHGFNGPSVWGGPWRTFAALFDGDDMDRTLSSALQIPDKPILISEVATEGRSEAGKAAWISDAYSRMLENPRIVGAVWFNADKETDWRLDSSPAALTAYRAAIAHPRVSENQPLAELQNRR